MAEDSNELLITLVRSRPILWDKSSDKYRHLGYTKLAWAEVCRKLNENFESMTVAEQDTFSKEVIKKWTNLRDAMVRSIRKNRKYVYGDQLQFLASPYETDPLEEEVEDESKSSQTTPVEINSEQLIACMEKWPCLWDKTLATYKDRTHHRSAWLEVLREMNPDFDQLEACEQEHYRKEIAKRWNNMRDTYAKSVKRTSGSGKLAKKYVYADQLYFLRRFYAASDDPGDEEWRFQDTNDEMEMPDPPDVVLHEHLEETVMLPTWDVQATSLPARENSATQEHGQPTWEPQSLANPRKRKRQEHQQDHHQQHEHKLQQQQEQQQNQLEQDLVDQRILNVLDRLEPENRHLSFFKGIVPSLENFDEEEVLQFQIQVLRIISDMRKRRRENRLSNSHGRAATQQPIVKSEVIMTAYLSEHSNNSSN